MRKKKTNNILFIKFIPIASQSSLMIYIKQLFFMEEKINESHLCVLRINEQTKEICLEYVPIENVFDDVLIQLKECIDNTNTKLPDLVNYLMNHKVFNQLNATYRYCIELDGAFQTINANTHEELAELSLYITRCSCNKEGYNCYKNESKYNKQRCNCHDHYLDIMQNLYGNYKLWSKAYSINKAYRLCYNDSSILTFSHRICGWSNPQYQLSPSFSLEVKTNFGYGSSSYFYIKLKYKEIDIVPLSNWVTYSRINMQELIRYTRKYELNNKYWKDALLFASKACNLSLKDESKFVNEYIIHECETMVEGLECILKQDQYTLLGNSKTLIKKEEMIEFRAEKISGALDFIGKILEYEYISKRDEYIGRIELCNEQLQPHLKYELSVLRVKLKNIQGYYDTINRAYLKEVSNDKIYQNMKSELCKEMISNGQLRRPNIDRQILEDEFKKCHPEYLEFEKNFKSIKEKKKDASNELLKVKKTYTNIQKAHDKIQSYFLNEYL